MSECAIYKSTAAEFLDEFYGGSPEDLRQAFDDALRRLEAHQDEPLSTTTEELERLNRLEPGAAGDFYNYWLSDTSRLAGSEVDRILRHGYREAIELARSHEPPMPIETFWLTGASHEFELHICEGRTRVTVVMFIPRTRRYGSKRARSRSWVIRIGEPREPDAELLDGADPPIVKVRLSGA